MSCFSTFYTRYLRALAFSLLGRPHSAAFDAAQPRQPISILFRRLSERQPNVRRCTTRQDNRFPPMGAASLLVVVVKQPA